MEEAERAERNRSYVRKHEQKYPERVKARRKRRREYIQGIINQAKNAPCRDCGGSFPPWVMDLHHRDPGDKKFRFGGGYTHTEEAIRAEIAKCDVLCANCHREVTK